MTEKGGEKMEKRKWMVSFAIMFTVIMLACSVTGVQAKLANNKKALPDFIEASIAMMYPNASDSKLDEIRALWMKQIELKQERMESNNAAVLNLNPSVLLSTTSYLSYLTKIEPIGGGQVINPNGIVGNTLNQDFTRFYTPGLNQGAGVAGRLSSDYASGDVYICGKLGPTGAGKTGNYLIVWGSNTGADWSWEPIGYTHIVYPYNPPWYMPSSAYHYVGYTSNTYKYAAVGCNTMMGEECVYNDVMADMIQFSSG
jgi:hypothetical protein